jgi:two-component system, OmpR family, sensor histidine kinase BaeS
MHLRLATTLTLALSGLMACAVLAMGALLAWNLRSGFDAYLSARDADRLASFARLAEARLAESSPTASSPISSLTPADLRPWLREFATVEGLAPPQGARPVPAGRLPSMEDGSQGGPPPRPGGSGSPIGPGAPGGPDGFGRRITLLPVDALHTRSPEHRGWPTEVLRVAGQPVALLALRPLPPAPNSVQQSFLRSQYGGIAAVATALIVVGAALAWELARRWSRRLEVLQQASARIAAGQFLVQLAPRIPGDEIDALTADVQRMAASLDRLQGARRRWLADLSHELRTPLAVLRGELEALVDGVRRVDAAALRSLLDEAAELSRRIDDLHTLAVTELAPMALQRESIDVGALLAKVQARFASAAAARRLRLTVAAHAGSQVHVDPDRLERVLATLVENSLRYTDAPGQVELGAQALNGTVRLWVQDSAPGVDAADLSRLFEPLMRTDVARARSKGGSGLGLAITAATVAAHGGQVAARASTLGGLCIEIVLPVPTDS